MKSSAAPSRCPLFLAGSARPRAAEHASRTAGGRPFLEVDPSSPRPRCHETVPLTPLPAFPWQSGHGGESPYGNRSTRSSPRQGGRDAFFMYRKNRKNPFSASGEGAFFMACTNVQNALRGREGLQPYTKKKSPPTIPTGSGAAIGQAIVIAPASARCRCVIGPLVRRDHLELVGLALKRQNAAGRESGAANGMGRDFVGLCFRRGYLQAGGVARWLAPPPGAAVAMAHGPTPRLQGVLTDALDQGQDGGRDVTGQRCPDGDEAGQVRVDLGGTRADLRPILRRLSGLPGFFQGNSSVFRVPLGVLSKGRRLIPPALLLQECLGRSGSGRSQSLISAWAFSSASSRSPAVSCIINRPQSR